MRETCFKPTKEEEKTVKELAPVYAGRRGILTAVLQYMFQTVKLSGMDKTEEGKEIASLLSQKLADFELLGSLLEKLETSPVFTACPPYPVSHHSAAYVDYAKTYPAMLASDLILEQDILSYLEGVSVPQEKKYADLFARLKDGARGNIKRLKCMLEKA